MKIIDLEALLEKHRIPLHLWGPNPEKKVQELHDFLETGAVELMESDEGIVLYAERIMISVSTEVKKIVRHLILQTRVNVPAGQINHIDFCCLIKNNDYESM